MGFRYKTPHRYSFCIVIHCVLIITVYILFYNFMNVKPFYYFVIAEIIITTLLILRGETVRILKYVVIFSTLMFLVLIAALLPSHFCCTSPISVWLSVLMGYIVFRCIYLWMLFHLHKKCCMEYDKKQIIMEQRMTVRDEQPFDAPFMAPTITGGLSVSNPFQGSALSAKPPMPGDSIGQGMDTIATHGGEKKAADYGWAV